MMPRITTLSLAAGRDVSAQPMWRITMSTQLDASLSNASPLHSRHPGATRLVSGRRWVKSCCRGRFLASTALTFHLVSSRTFSLTLLSPASTVSCFCAGSSDNGSRRRRRGHWRRGRPRSRGPSRTRRGTRAESETTEGCGEAHHAPPRERSSGGSDGQDPRGADRQSENHLPGEPRLCQRRRAARKDFISDIPRRLHKQLERRRLSFGR